MYVWMRKVNVVIQSSKECVRVKRGMNKQGFGCRKVSILIYDLLMFYNNNFLLIS
jgi:hypothetical protein